MGQKSDQLISATPDDAYPLRTYTAVLPEDGGLAPNAWADAKGQVAAFEAGDGEMDPDIKAAREAIERTRGQMSGMIDAISERLNPQVLARQAKAAVHDATIGKVEGAVSTATSKVHDALNTAGESLGDAAHRLRDAVTPAANTTADVTQATGAVMRSKSRSLAGTIRSHPLPAAVVGLGAGWLFWRAARK